MRVGIEHPGDRRTSGRQSICTSYCMFHLDCKYTVSSSWGPVRVEAGIIGVEIVAGQDWS
jgi:hypothetical protein